jgi:hypothetical protein
MRLILTMTLAATAFSFLGGWAYAESRMNSSDLIKEMHPDVKAASEGKPYEGRSATHGPAPIIAPEEGRMHRPAPHTRRAPAEPYYRPY